MALSDKQWMTPADPSRAPDICSHPEYHHSDGSFRWIAPADIPQDVWDAGIRAHRDGAQHTWR